MSLILRAIVLVFAIHSSAESAQNVGSTQEGYWIPDSSGRIINQLKQNPLLTFDHLNRQGFEVYGPMGLKEQLQNLQVDHVDLMKLEFLTRAQQGYPSFLEIEAQIKALHQKYPELTELFSIGKSNQGRDLWVLKLSDNPSIDEIEPEVKLISSMHGNEITGRELMIKLADELLSSYAIDPSIQAIIDQTEIFIMPSMNPDGSEVPMRGNARYIDLNRNFPDFSTSDAQNTLTGREVETQAVMMFQSERQFSLSANFHGGAEVVNYMWDTIEDDHPYLPLLLDISKSYVEYADYMKNPNEFPEGITNGYAWYEVNGGMQDWSYHWYGDLQFTVELSQEKWPAYSSIASYYDANRLALIDFLRRVHQGAGFAFSGAKFSGFVRIQKQSSQGWVDQGTFSFRNSEFFKVLPVGQYRFQIFEGQSLNNPIAEALLDVRSEVRDDSYLIIPE